jgi:uncharacterized protein (DUF2141 family)
MLAVSALAVCQLGLSAEPATEAVLRIEVRDLRDADGSLRVSVFSKPDGFLKDDSKACARGVLRATDDAHIVEFRLPPGTYAVAILHDENNNGRLDTNFFGIPSEGYGVSNNPKPRFRAPKFKEAIFTLPEAGTTATVSLQYVG